MRKVPPGIQIMSEGAWATCGGLGRVGARPALLMLHLSQASPRRIMLPPRHQCEEGHADTRPQWWPGNGRRRLSDEGERAWAYSVRLQPIKVRSGSSTERLNLSIFRLLFPAKADAD